jgi:hypothetical protein
MTPAHASDQRGASNVVRATAVKPIAHRYRWAWACGPSMAPRQPSVEWEWDAAWEAGRAAHVVRTRVMH